MRLSFSTLSSPLFKKICLCCLAFVPVSSSFADIQPRGVNLSYAQKSFSNAANSAAAAMVVKRKGPNVMTGGFIEIGAGIEYGDFDELFDKINELSAVYKPSDDEGDGGDSGGGDGGDSDDSNKWELIFEKYPDLEDRLDAIKDQVVSTAAVVVVIAAEGYGKAEATAEATFVINEDLYGGTLLLSTAFKGSSKVVGIFDDMNFDRAVAKEQLLSLPNYTETDPVQELDLSGGITLFYDPATKNAKISIKNDSLLLVKAAKINEFSLSYSHQALQLDSGELYWGVKPTYYRVGLTNIGTRIGDLSDSESIFDDIKDADYTYSSGFDVDFGLVWAAEHYQLGASLKNVIEQTFNFPELDRGRFKSAKIIAQLKRHEEYKMDRQLKLEAGIYTKERHWSLHAEYDANSVADPMRDQYQWLTVTGGYSSSNWWLPSARIGFSKNYVGSELSYINLGVTVMKYLNIDLATTIDTVMLDGEELNRGVSFRMGVQFDY
jgi:hypothetical protein